MATITTRKGYRNLNFTDPQTGKRRRIPLAKVGILTAKQERDILIAKEFELSTGARLLNVHRRPAPRFKDFARDYLIWHAAEYPDSHYRVEQIAFDHLIPHFGETPLNLISAEQGEDYKAKRRPLVTANTVAKEWRVFMAFLNRAVDTKIITENPVSSVKAPQTLNSKPHHYYQRAELKALYKASAYGPVWRLLANTGLRRGEGRILRWLWVTDQIRIQSTGEERTKSGEWRKIPISVGATAALAALKRLTGASPYVLPRIAPESLSRAFLRDARACGLPGSLHSLRHTYICHLLMQPGVSIRTVQLYAGHAHITTTEKYAYQVLNQAPDAALKLAI